jgi:hypothetical protein
MDGIKPFGLGPAEPYHLHGTDLESGLFNAVKNAPRRPPRRGVWLDDGECSFHRNGQL